ncbi:hypothetical protein FRC20_006159 [Serendipita sp. 405]|nr:hypothetical protein FRC20_006159 [Serendipita sp. 405]
MSRTQAPLYALIIHLVISTTPKAQERMSQRELIRVSVVGAGLGATVFHVPLVLSSPDLFILHSVVERTPPAEMQPEGTIAKKFNVKTKLVNKFEDVLSDEAVELVIITTPNSTHYGFAKAALEAGKHVLVDKPVTTTYEEAQELGRIATRKNLILYAFQNRRWDSDYLTLRKVLQNGSLGHITDFVSQYDRYRNFLKGSWKESAKAGSGLIYDLGTHLIDQALHLFGRPARITAFLQNLRGIGEDNVDDNFTILLHYPRTEQNPYLLTVTLCAHPLSQRTPQLRYTIRGSKGTFVKHGLDVQEEQMKELGVKAFGKAWFGRESEEIQAELEVVEKEGDNAPLKSKITSEKGDYRALYRNLGAAIRDGEELKVKWKEAEMVMLIVDLAIVSSREGRTLDVPEV